MMAVVILTEDKRNISLGKELARGGEGVVYEIDSTTVAKIYFEPKGRLDKMKAFIRKKISIDGVCTPKELLFNENNQFIGYLMV